MGGAKYNSKYDIEAISALVHEAWIKSKQSKGVSSRKLDTTGEELMVPYDQLSVEAKDLDRVTVRTVVEAIESLEKTKVA